MNLAALFAFLATPINLITVSLLIVILVVLAIYGKIKLNIRERYISFGNSRSCGDCLTLLMAKRIKYEGAFNNIYNNILRGQMVYAEHTLYQMETLLESKAPTLKYEIKASLNTLQDEIRRSMKENGFHEMEEKDFRIYVKDRESFVLNHLKSTLPTITLDEANIVNINIFMYDIYESACEVVDRANMELKKLEDKFIDDTNGIIKQ